jgi:hypothetical protein
VIGTLLVLIALTLLGAGGTAVWADQTQREAGYVTTGEHNFSTTGAALATARTELGSPGIGWLYPSGLLGKIRIRVTPVSGDPSLFVGIGPGAEVDRYLAGVKHTLISDFFGDKAEAVDGGALRSPPRSQDFWAASATGAGTRTLVWEPDNGSWTVVVMNANGRPGLDVRADVGARMPHVIWIAVGVIALGMVVLAGGTLLMAGAIRHRRSSPV